MSDTKTQATKFRTLLQKYGEEKIQALLEGKAGILTYTDEEMSQHAQMMCDLIVYGKTMTKITLIPQSDWNDVAENIDA